MNEDPAMYGFDGSIVEGLIGSRAVQSSMDELIAPREVFQDIRIVDVVERNS